MFLADIQIRAHLDALDFKTELSERPFEPDKQIQPCSVDLRLDNIIWRKNKRGVINLGSSLVDSIFPRRGWHSSRVLEGASILIGPGETVFARVYERFRMPPTLAGKLEGRSSLARLGLFVHCSSGFVNPGWFGYMPLQLHNAGPHAIRLPPYIPICQLMLIQLTSQPERTYGHDGLNSKYQDDDGGPSYWWNDKRIKELHAQIQQRSLPAAIETRFVELTKTRDAEIIERFQKFVSKLPVSEAQDPDLVIDRFAKKEQLRKAGRGISSAVPAFISLTLLAIILTNIEAGQGFLEIWKSAAAAVVSGGFALWAKLRPSTGYLLPGDVATHRLTENRMKELPPPSTGSEEPTGPGNPPSD